MLLVWVSVEVHEDIDCSRVSRDVLTRLIKGVDYRTIANLPEEWPEDVEADESGLETFGEQKRFGSTAPCASIHV